MAIFGVAKLTFTFLNILFFTIFILSYYNFNVKIVSDNATKNYLQPMYNFLSDKQFRYSEVRFRQNLTLKKVSEVKSLSLFKTTTTATTTTTTTTSEFFKVAKAIGSEKLYLIVPYRDREENRKVFIEEMKTFLNNKV